MVKMEIVAVSPLMRELVAMVEKIAHTDANLLMQGESGSGKDLITNFLHYQSHRREAQLVKIDCATLPAGLVESELFGYERGAFTGATTSKPGRFEIAHGGTLVFDEIVNLDLHAQAKLLRVIEERTFMRLGGSTAIKVDVRFVTLTHMDLKLAVKRGLLRADLYHRLNVVSLEIPPLSRHIEDLPYLIKHFLGLATARHNKKVETISAEALEILTSYEFPGNVRELQNIIERAVIMAQGNIIEIEHLPTHIISAKRLMQVYNHQLTLEELEAFYIREVLIQTRGHKTRAAKILGISRKNLYEKLKKYAIRLYSI